MAPSCQVNLLTLTRLQLLISLQVHNLPLLMTIKLRSHIYFQLLHFPITISTTILFTVRLLLRLHIPPSIQILLHFLYLIQILPIFHRCFHRVRIRHLYQVCNSLSCAQYLYAIRVTSFTAAFTWFSAVPYELPFVAILVSF